jgi:hypothetical protein
MNASQDGSNGFGFDQLWYILNADKYTINQQREKKDVGDD